jgi:hypothetical protein
MRKKLLFSLLLAFCLSLMMGMSVSANTGELIDVSDGVSEGSDVSEPPPTSEPPSRPVEEIKFVITITAPRGWYTKSTTVTVKLEDVNGTGQSLSDRFQKAEVKQGGGGVWQDISDALRSYGQTDVEISDNGTVYVAVTDQNGKAHVKSLYVECFDREAPAIKAKIEGRSLRAEADDSQSGVESIYVNGICYDDLTNDTLDVRLRDIAADDEQEIFVYAVDYAGNRSRTVSIKNPEYIPPASSAPAATAVQTPVPVVQAPAVSQPTESANAQSPVVKLESEKPSAESNPGSITPTDGSGTVIENSVKTPGEREFFTITTQAGNDFYIVVDKEKADQNVYLLSEVTEDDLAGLAKPGASPVPEIPATVPTLEPEPEVEPTTPPTSEPPTTPEKSSNTGSIALIIAVVVVCGGAAYYLKIVRPKKNAADPYEDEEDGIGEDDSDYDNEYEQDGDESEG